MDNQRLHDEGVQISEKVLKKHRSDVIRLSGLLPTDARLELEGQLKADALQFFGDFKGYLSRVTDRKRHQLLGETYDFLQGVYL